MPGSSVHVPGDVFAGVRAGDLMLAVEVLRDTEEGLREFRVLQGSRGLAAEQTAAEVEALRRVREALEVLAGYAG